MCFNVKEKKLTKYKSSMFNADHFVNAIKQYAPIFSEQMI